MNVEPDALKSDHGDDEDDDDEAHGGHDSPNWSKAKSATVLLGCTVLYSIIAGKNLTSAVAADMVGALMMRLIF